jgi:UPF0271 protein
VRATADDGQLVSRKLGADALVTDPLRAADQAVRMVMAGKVRTITSKTLDVRIDTICIHGDSPGAHRIVAAVREALVKAGAVVEAGGRFLIAPDSRKSAEAGRSTGRRA